MNHHVISSGNPHPPKYPGRWTILDNIGPPGTRLEGILTADFLKTTAFLSQSETTSH